MIKILNAVEEDPIRNMCIHSKTVTLVEYSKKKTRRTKTQLVDLRNKRILERHNTTKNTRIQSFVPYKWYVSSMPRQASKRSYTYAYGIKIPSEI